MAKIIISCDGQAIREVELGTERMTIGRHPQNDIVLDHPTVSARHACITLLGDQVLLEDLGSTNGTCVNGKRVERIKLADRGHATLAACELDFVAGVTALPSVPPTPVPAAIGAPSARIEVRTGANAGRCLNLTKPLTTLGSPGVLVVVIARLAAGYTLTHIEGETVPIVNGTRIGKEPHALRDGDVIDLAGTTMSFIADR